MKIAKLSTSPDFFRWYFNIDNIQDFIEKKERVNDADVCGDRTTYWVVMEDGNKKYYKCSHEWWWEVEDDYLVNEFEIKEIDRTDIEDDYAKRNLKFVV